jgi:hypothetical protein
LIVADIGIQNSIRNTTNLFWRDWMKLIFQKKVDLK